MKNLKFGAIALSALLVFSPRRVVSSVVAVVPCSAASSVTSLAETLVAQCLALLSVVPLVQVPVS